MNRIAKLRKERGLSQLSLSLLTGIAQANISLIETGRIRCWPGWRKRIAKALDVTEEKLFPERGRRSGA